MAREVDARDEAVFARLHPDAVRRRRTQAKAAWVLALVVGLAASWLIVRGDGRSHYGDLSWSMPSSWGSHDSGGAGCHVKPDALAVGPFIGTVRTSSIYRPTGTGWECGVPIGVPSHLPDDAVIAWISLGRPLLDPALNLDPGAAAESVCGPGSAHPGSRVFHAYRLFGDTSSGMRVALDGCAFGPGTIAHLAELDAVAASLTYPVPA